MKKKLATSIFSFPHNVFKRSLPRGSLGKGITLYQIPNDEILDWFKLQAFADDNKCDTKLKFGFEKVENVGKGENAGYQHFLLFLQCFQWLCFSAL